MTSTDFAGGDDLGFGVAVRPDGRIVLAGYVPSGGNDDFALVRYLGDTTLGASLNSATDVPLRFEGLDAAGRTLNVSLGFAPVVGTSLKVFDNTSLQPISGEFVNLAQGQAVTLNHSGTDYYFVANYFGGDGNDLVLEWAYNRLVAWGNNGDGNLGSNSTVSQFNLPVAVTAAPAIYGKHLLQVAAGNAHSLAVASDGSVAAWGYNGVGQLGNGGTTNTLTPVAVIFSGDLAGKKAVSVAAGWMHSLALFSDGTVAAWGHGGYGQLGNNSNFNSSTPVKVSTTGALAGKRVMAIAAGFNHSAALCSDGTVVCWGANDARQLGNGGTLNSAVPAAVVHAGVLAGKAVKAICAGYGHTLALCTDGSVAAWGANANQQLGNNSTVNSNVPVAVTSSGLLAGRQVVTVAAGGDTSMALCSDGTLVSWGHNDRGQIGSGSAVTSFGEPQAVDMTGALSGRTVTSIQMGFRHALALCDDGVLAAWGSNVYGQLGNSTVTDAYSPVLVSAGAVTATEKFTGISGGSYANHSLAVVGTTAPTPLIVVEQPVGTAISDGSSVAFGNTLVGTTRTRTFLIKNTGTATLSGIACSLAGSGAGFYSVIQAPAATVAPGDSTTFTVRFTPALPNGPKAATLNIANNVTAVNDINPFNVALSGVAQSSLTLSYATGAEVPATANGFSATGKTIVTNTSSLTHAPLAGAALMILDNTGPSFVTGTFTYNSQALTHGSTIQMS